MTKVHAQRDANVKRARVFSVWKATQLAYSWTTWGFICFMVSSQLLCIVWNYTTTSRLVHYFGTDPLVTGVAPIVGTNDMPFSDRSVACIGLGSEYKPMLISQVFERGFTAAINISNSTNGYRLIKRQQLQVIDPSVLPTYYTLCKLLGDSFQNILAACADIGYPHAMRDYLRVVDDFDSTTSYIIKDSLPVLIMPFWDNAPYARFAVPTWDGDACIFRVVVGTGNTGLTFRGVNKSIRHARTIEWLGKPGGKWRNGWYEDRSGVKWNVDVISTYPTSKYNIMLRQFDMRTGKEYDCSSSSACREDNVGGTWGSQFETMDINYDIDSIYIGNASQHGLFLYHSKYKRIVSTRYTWETFLANTSVIFVLTRWMLAMVALHAGYHRNEAVWYGGGIGCVVSSRVFNLLPVTTLPRLKMTLCAFWTIGCEFEGQQLGLSAAWFVMYPAIVELVLTHFSLLHAVAKVLRRRITDTLFAPTIIVLSALHYFRAAVCASGWLHGVDSRVSTQIFSDELEKLTLTDFLTTDVALRMNGNVRELFIFKLVVLAINVLPLVFAEPLHVSRGRLSDMLISKMENAMAVRKDNLGGIGRPPFHAHELKRQRTRSAVVVAVHKRFTRFDHLGPKLELPTFPHRPFLSSYELVRLGYVVLGGKYIVDLDDWQWLLWLGLCRKLFPVRPFNHRFFMWTLCDPSNEKDAKFRRLTEVEPELCRLGDPRFEQVPFWQISTCDIE